jgi:hypothetical protein
MPHALAMDVDLGNNDAIDPVPLAPSDHSIPSQVLRPTCGSRPPQRQQSELHHKSFKFHCIYWY